jgi:antitoxin FitA
MATLQVENLPDEIYQCVQNLAATRKLTVNETIIFLLKQAFEPSQSQIDQLKSMAEVLQRIRDRPRLNPINFGLPDSTTLIREDRDR